jgi:hypothetical protein
MEPQTPVSGIVQLALLAAFLIPAILFTLTQQNTLKIVSSENRELRPGLVWLQLIPLFSYYWVFVVVTRIADSISKEVVARQDDTILGVPDFDAVQAVSRRPTYKIGMAWCILFSATQVGVILVNMTITPNPHASAIELLSSGFMCLSGVALIPCWIVYWVKLAQNKRKLQRFQY